MSLASVDTDLIRQQVKGLEKETSHEGLNIKYSYLFDNFPAIFFMVRDKTSNYKPTLRYMLDSVDKIKRGEVTLEQKNTEVYDLMDERYVQPVADELERLEKEKKAGEANKAVKSGDVSPDLQEIQETE